MKKYALSFIFLQLQTKELKHILQTKISDYFLHKNKEKKTQKIMLHHDTT